MAQRKPLPSLVEEIDQLSVLLLFCILSLIRESFRTQGALAVSGLCPNHGQHDKKDPCPGGLHRLAEAGWMTKSW